jgi:hypothetical protein
VISLLHSFPFPLYLFPFISASFPPSFPFFSTLSPHHPLSLLPLDFSSILSDAAVEILLGTQTLQLTELEGGKGIDAHTEMNRKLSLFEVPRENTQLAGLLEGR